MQMFGQPITVFDDYDARLSTRDITQIWRSGGIIGSKVKFDGNTTLIFTKEYNAVHKGSLKRFVGMLSRKLQAADCHDVDAKRDADVPIAKTTEGVALTHPHSNYWRGHRLADSHVPRC